MVTIAEARGQISKAKQQVQQRKEQIKSIEQKKPTKAEIRTRSRQDLLQQKIGVKRLEGLKEEELKRLQPVEEQITSAEQQVMAYLKTEQGKLQYAKEQGFKGEPIYDRVVKGGAIETVGYKYKTPYGEVIDYSPKRRLEFQQAKVEAYESAQAAAVGGALGLTSPKKIEQAGINVQDFLKEKPIEIKETLGNVTKGTIIQYDKGEGIISQKGIEVSDTSSPYDVQYVPIEQRTDKSVFRFQEPVFGTMQYDPVEQRYIPTRERVVLAKDTNIAQDVSSSIVWAGRGISAGAGLVLGTGAAKVTEEYYASKGLTEMDIAVPERQFKYTEPVFGTPQYDPNKQQYIFETTKDVTLPAVTVGEKIETARIIGKNVGEIGTTVGIYMTPYIGAGYFASEIETELRDYDYNPIKFAKDKPVQALVLGGTAIGIGTLKGIKFARAEKVIKTGDDILLTTRAESLFGKKIRVSRGTKGNKILDTTIKFEITPSNLGTRIRKIGRDFEVTAAETIGKDFGKTVEFMQQQVGLKTTPGRIAETRTFWRETFGRGALYKGTPYGSGRAGYLKASKLLQKRGYTPSQAQQILRYTAQRQYQQKLLGGLGQTKKGTTGGFRYQTVQPRVYDPKTGLYTRKGKTTQEFVIIDRVGKDKIAAEYKTAFREKPQELVYSEGVLFGKAGKVEKGYDVFESRIFKGTKPAEIQRVGGTAISRERLNIRFGTTKPIPLETEASVGRTILVKSKKPKPIEFTVETASKKSSDEFYQQLYKPEQKLKISSELKLAPPTPKIKTPKQVLEPRELPRMVGGQGLRTIPYARMGLYERAQFGIARARTRAALGTGLALTPRVRADTRVGLKEQLEIVQKTSPTQDTKLGEIQVTKVSPTTKQSPVLKTSLKTQLAQQVATKQTPLLKTTQPPKPIPPKIKIPIIPQSEGQLKDKLVKKLKSLKGKGMDVVTGQGKKKKVIARNLPPFKAMVKGRKYVDRNIEATYRLVRSKSKAKPGKDIKPRKLSPKFRPSKRNVLAIVEKRKYRLDSPLEKRQIKRRKR